MSVQNRLKKIIDRKSWEQMSQPPVASASGMCVVADPSGYDKDAVILTSATAGAGSLYLYDHEQDAYVQPIAHTLGGTTPTLVGATGAYSPKSITGVSIQGTYSSIATHCAIATDLGGFMIRIIGGTGAGQERIISDNSQSNSFTVTTSAGSATATLTSGNPQFIPPGVLVSGNANITAGGAVTVSSISGTTITLSTGTGITAGTSVLTNFGSVIFVSQPWTVVPDASSVFIIYSGRWYFQLGAATLANTSIGFYDRALNLFQNGSVTGVVGNYGSSSPQFGWGTALAANYGVGTAWGTDAQMISTPSNKTGFVINNGISGTSTGANNAVTLNDTTQNLTYNTYQGLKDMAVITGGTGVGQVRLIMGNTINQLQIYPAWTTVPDNTSTYSTFSYGVYFSATAGASSNATTINGTFTTAGQWVNFAIRITAGTGVGSYGLITANTTGALTVSGIYSADATSVFQILGPQGYGQFISNGTSNTTTQTNFASSVFTANSLTNHQMYLLVVGGTGAGQIRRIVSNTATQVTTDVLGTALDATSTVVIMGYAGFCSGIATASGATTLTAGAKNWFVNQWANYQVRICAGTGAGQIREIVSNTANILTLQTFTPWQVTGLGGAATVVAATTTSPATITGLTSTANLYPGMQLSGFTGTGTISGTTTILGILSTTAISVATSGTVTAGAITAVTFGVLPDTTSMFVIEGNDDQLYLGGNNAITLYRLDLTNLYHVGTAPAFTTLAPTVARAGAMVAGGGFSWVADSTDPIWQNENEIKNGRRIYSFRGGATATLDYYDIALNTWISALPYKNSSDTLTTGSGYTVDQGEIYIQKDATGRCFRFNTSANELIAFAVYPVPQGAAIVGNRIWVRKYTDVSTLKWMYFFQNTLQSVIRIMAVDRG